MLYDYLIDELNTLRDEAMEINLIERVYNILLGYRSMSMSEIKRFLSRDLQSDEIGNDVKPFLAWVHNNIKSSISKADFILTIDSVLATINERKGLVENKLLVLFYKLKNCYAPDYVELASNFLDKRDEISLYDQMVISNALFKKNNVLPNGESFPGTSGRGCRG